MCLGKQKREYMRDRSSLAFLFHCNMLSLAAIEATCSDSNDLKSLQKISTFLITDILREMRQEITVCINI